MGKNIKGGKKHKKQKNQKQNGGSERSSSMISRPVGDDQCIGRITGSFGSKRFNVSIKGKNYNCRLRGSRQLKGSSAYASDKSYCLCSHRGYENVYDILNVYYPWEVGELRKEGLIPKEEGQINYDVVFDDVAAEDSETELEKIMESNGPPKGHSKPKSFDLEMESSDEEDEIQNMMRLQRAMMKKNE